MECRIPPNNQYVQKTSVLEFSNLNCHFEGLRKRILALKICREAIGINKAIFRILTGLHGAGSM
jgi:hypothetical protein